MFNQHNKVPLDMGNGTQNEQPRTKNNDIQQDGFGYLYSVVTSLCKNEFI